MLDAHLHSPSTRRAFLRNAGATALAGSALAHGLGATVQQSETNWASRAGIGLYMVRDQMADEGRYRDTLSKLAAMGYKEVEPADRSDFGGRGYAGLDPKSFRALLDSNGLAMPSTHTSAIEGPDLESQLEGFQVMGIRYTEIISPTSSHATGGAATESAPGAAARASAGPAPPPARTVDEVRRIIDHTNANARIAQKFGIKLLVRMDIDVFVPLSDKPDSKPFEVIADNTDASMVTMQIDLGWAPVAGLDPVAMFKRNPGRYELWHVKDVVGLHTLTPGMSLADRRRSTYFVPVGLGQIDWKNIFANAGIAGLKHYGIEQDNALTWGDSMAAALVNHDNLVKLLS